MPAFVSITLDTAAPVVVFGDPTGTTAGELFQVPYVADEPLASAVLIDAAQRQLALTIDTDHLSVLLPPDTADGPARIRFTDAYGNADEAPIGPLAGTIAVPAPSRPPQYQLPEPRRTQRRRLTARTTIAVSLRARRVQATPTRHVRHRVAAALTVSVKRSGTHPHLVVLAANSRTSRRAALHWTSDTITLSSQARIRRGDDPVAVAILLDLL